MKPIIAIAMLHLLTLLPFQASGDDYTNRGYTTHACELFAQDVYLASENFSQGILLTDVLVLVESASVSESKRNRLFQAVQFVWKNQLDHPVLAYTLAMGLCLKPKEYVAPMDEPWVVSPRTISGNY